jgi:chromosome segregation ATPase
VRQLREQLDAAHKENAELIRDRDAARERAVEDSTTIGALRATNAGLTSRREAGEAALADRDRQIAELKAHWNAALERANGLGADLTAAHRERAGLEQTTARLGAELDAAKAAADQERAALTCQADDADRRSESLLAAFAAAGVTAATTTRVPGECLPPGPTPDPLRPRQQRAEAGAARGSGAGSATGAASY